MLGVKGTECIGSCKSNYHTITTIVIIEIYSSYIMYLLFNLRLSRHV